VGAGVVVVGSTDFGMDDSFGPETFGGELGVRPARLGVSVGFGAGASPSCGILTVMVILPVSESWKSAPADGKSG
jgi:hypothetical protein